MAADWPPMGLPDPGLTFTVRTPPATASAKPRSAGLMASRARTWGVTGSVISLVSCPAHPSASSCTPRWVWASTRPGSTTLPAAPTHSAPSGTGTSRPTTIANGPLRAVASKPRPFRRSPRVPDQPARTLTLHRLQTESTWSWPKPPPLYRCVPLSSTATAWMSTWLKAPLPVILKFPPPYRLKLLQSKDQTMRQAYGARNPGLRPTSLPSYDHSSSSGLLLGPIEVGGVVVGAGLVTVVAGWVVAAGSANCWSTRQPSRAVIAASPM